MPSVLTPCASAFADGVSPCRPRTAWVKLGIIRGMRMLTLLLVAELAPAVVLARALEVR